MRGKDSFDIERYEGVGITPAYAGKSNIFLNSVLARKDHPCVCGEK